MRRKLMSGLVAVALLGFAPQAFAQGFLLGPEIAWNDAFDIGIGAGAEFGLGSVAEGLGLYGDFLYFFPGDVDLGTIGKVSQDYLEFNANATYVFPLKDSSITPFALAGANFGNANIDYEGFGEDIDSSDDGFKVGVNLGGGIQFNLGDFRPRVGARFVLGGYETFTVFGFLPFQVGG